MLKRPNPVILLQHAQGWLQPSLSGRGSLAASLAKHICERVQGLSLGTVHHPWNFYIRGNCDTRNFGVLEMFERSPHLPATVAQLMASCAGTWTVSRTPATIDLGLVQCPCGRKSQMAKKARPVTSFAILQRWTDSVNQTRLTRST